jgi:ABC-type multidrug transport system permease subunit
MLRDRLCFERAQMARMYSISAYYFSRLTHYITLGSANCMLLSLIIYFSIGLNTEDASHFFIFYVIMVAGFLNACGKTLIVTSLFDSMEAAFALSPVLFVPFFLFAGLLINNDDYPDYIFWMKFISDA